jgi:hypothetical protein
MGVLGWFSNWFGNITTSGCKSVFLEMRITRDT